MLNSSNTTNASAFTKATWTVYRQDDNGNRFVMDRHLSEEVAAQLVAKFEARGHKQLYWAELDSAVLKE